jgi:serine/threonine-protein phosphatase 2A regulatory subunit A
LVPSCKAATSLSKIASTLDDTTDFCRIVVEDLAKSENWFTSKVSACALFQAPYPNASSDTKANLLAMFAALAKDSTPMVRRAAAKNIGFFAKSVSTHARADLDQHILPLFASLCNDKTDSVKIAALDESMVEIALLMEVSESKERILPLVLQAAEDDSWRQRNAIAKNINRLIVYFLSSDDATEELDGTFKALLQDSEGEVRSQALQSASKLGVDNKPIFKKLQLGAALQQSIDDPINQGMGAKPCRMALADACIQIIDADLKKSILPVINKLLRDEEVDVSITSVFTFLLIFNF